MRRAPGLITREGVGLENDAFLHHRMRDKLGRHVELRYRDMDDTWVEAHYAGKLLCVALSTEILAADQDRAEKIIFTRATDRRKAHVLLAEAKRMAEDYVQAEQNVANPAPPTRPTTTTGALAKKPDPFGYRRDHD